MIKKNQINKFIISNLDEVVIMEPQCKSCLYNIVPGEGNCKIYGKQLKEVVLNKQKCSRYKKK